MENKNLIRKMGRLGFSLFETEEVDDANIVLYEVLKSKETRLWEGFPILLANASREGKFDHVKIMNLCKDQEEKDAFLDFLSLSLAMYKYFHLKFSWGDEIYKRFSENEKEKSNLFLACLKENTDLQISNRSLNATRIKSIFGDYYEEEGTVRKEVRRKHEELALEYATSQIFSPKQKDLFFKKFKGEKMTKTEQEYYSRLVKKKIVALANSELHKLARNILKS